jgi:hypothetical protein
MRLGGVVTGLSLFLLGAGVNNGLEPLQSLIFPEVPVTRAEDGTPIKFLDPDEYDKLQERNRLRDGVEKHFSGQFSGVLKFAGSVVALWSLVVPIITPKKY